MYKVRLLKDVKEKYNTRVYLKGEEVVLSRDDDDWGDMNLYHFVKTDKNTYHYDHFPIGSYKIIKEGI